jgi:hypothetical protein
MTRSQAHQILHEAGEVYTGPASLSGIRARTGDPVILRACDRLAEDAWAMAARRPRLWVELGPGGSVTVKAGAAAAAVRS